MRIAEGSIAAYNSSLNASNKGARYGNSLSSVTIEDLPNIDIVIVPNNPELWTRVPVLQYDTKTGESKADSRYRLHKNTIASVDKDGNTESGSTGMGWFPGYAIDIDNGVKLNMMVSESRTADPEFGENNIWEPTNADDGGNSFIYIMTTEYNETYYQNIMDSVEAANGANITGFSLGYGEKVFSDVSWVVNPRKSKSQGLLVNDLKIRVRVDREFRTSEVDNNIPTYQFSTDAYVPILANKFYLESLLDRIRVVPNPYYAYSEYENNQIDNIVRITNLPNKCNISIYTVSGTLVRQLIKDDNNPFINWNLKTEGGLNIASGAYLIHVEAEGIGEKVIKFFGVMRPLDIDTF